MLRKFTKQDRQFFIDCAKQFYCSDAVVSNVSEKNFEATFDMLMNNDPLIDGYVLQHEGQNAGYFLASFAYSNEAGGTVMWLEELFVLPQFRNKGLASELFEYVKANFSDKVKRFRLEAVKSNARAVRLYEKNGFKELKYMQMYIDN